MSRKTLAEELAELANPAPTKEFDPDADIFGSGPALEASDDELLPPSKPKGKERSRLRGDIQLLDKEYSGRKSSRAAVFDQDDDDDPDDNEDGSSEEEGEGDDEEEQEEEDSELEIASDDEVASSSDEEEEEEEENEDEEYNSEKEEEEEARKNKKQNKSAHSFGSEDADAEEDDEAAALEREYREIQQQEADAMSGLQERASKERKKGLAVRAQRSIWESGLELRILLQKALQSGNRLPQPEGHRVAVTVDPKLETGLKGLARDAAAVVDDLLGLLSSMEEQHPAIEEAAKAAGVESTKRKHPDNDAEKDEEKQEVSDKLWSQLDESYQRFIPFRDASIDRWHRKTVLASGSAARAGLKVLNQSVSSQVQLLMRDSQRVVERTRLPKRLCRPLCSTEEDQEGSAEVQEEHEAADQGIVAGDEIRDPETFDDGEFYQTLLKEFFEGKQEGGANWYSGPKQRKLVDRRASKGRKLRYHIHEKLANFMAPVELNAPQFASNIFANLFGGAAGRK